MKKYDVIINGAGLVGLATAISLAKANISVFIIDKNNMENIFNPIFDNRSSAISAASVRLFKQLNIWENIVQNAGEINDVIAVDAHSPSFVHYDKESSGGEALGYIIPNIYTRKALLEEAMNYNNISLNFSDNIKELKRDNLVEIHLKSGTQVEANLLIIADGRFSKLRDEIGVNHRLIKYGQTAIVGTISHELPHNGVALERFFPEGPLAILPMVGKKSCIVWTEQDAMAAEILSLTKAEQEEEINIKIGDYLGRITIDDDLFSYPLTLMQAEKYTAYRAVLVGDAAHGIHPIAGQGVNLGYRDVAVLAEILENAKNNGQDLGIISVLDKYNRWRSFDAVSMAGIMHGLTYLFSNDIFPVKIARRIGLDIVNQIPPLKKFFMKHAMGLLGDVPPLMRIG